VSRPTHASVSRVLQFAISEVEADEVSLRIAKGGSSMLGWYVLAGFVVAIIGVIVVGEATKKRKE